MLRITDGELFLNQGFSCPPNEAECNSITPLRAAMNFSFHERAMYAESSDLRPFALWFQSHEGFVDASVMDIATFLGLGGRGVIAVTEIPVQSQSFQLSA